MKKPVEKSRMTIKKVAPPKGQKTRDQYTVVLEYINENIKGIAEGVQILDNRLDRLEIKVDVLETKVDKLDSSTGRLESEVSIIRHSMITRDELMLLEGRVSALEKKSL